ncbi:MAG: putative DNA-binding domain-containing protein [Methyloceanibacter sp.]|nr:putative DNA-binding domain-containing protein [Methyloceanibacter sp.]
MTRFADLQRDFAGAVLDPEAAVPAPVSHKAGGSPSRRFGVYRNNVYASLLDVLAGRFPVVARLVGEEFFRAMARVYIEREPPRSAMLIRYGASFPAFVAGFAPAASVAYLADMASLEWAWHAAYHAPDAAALLVAELARAVGHAEDAVLTLHSSLSVVRSPFPIVTIFELNMQGGDVPPTRLEGGQDALVARPRLEVEMRRLPAGGAPFILALKEGKSLGEAATIAFGQASGFDLQANLAGLIAGGAIIGVRPHPRD